MDLTLTEEQQMLRDAVRGLCESYATPDDIRALEDDPTGYSQDIWQGLAQMDLLGLSLPVAHGGSGMGTLETVVLHEELGRHLVPSPHLVGIVIAGGLLARYGSDDQQSTWLPKAARGEAVMTVGWYEDGRGDDESSVQLTASSDGDDVVLDGAKILVPFASSADAILVLGRAAAGVEIYLVPADADGVSMEQTETLASDASYKVVFDDVRVPLSARVGEAGAGWDAWVKIMDDAAIVIAASAVGGAGRAHELAVAYAKERVQFGVPIGSFQGLAHPLADTATDIEGARALTYEAAWVRDTHGDAGPLPLMAKQWSAEVFRVTGRVGHQVFGGIGFTRAIDIQLYFRRAKQLELQWFSSRTLLDRIAAAELDAEVPYVSPDPGWEPDARHAVHHERAS